MKLIVGLGNTGEKYANTRHNLGFMALDRLALEHALPNFSNSDKFKAQLLEAEVGGQKVLLAKPTTMMNLSGQAIGKLAAFYKIASADIIVVYDELDLAFGKLRIRQGGGTAGHNGLKSIVEAVGDGFVRYRIGIANAHLRNPIPADAFVLAPFETDEQKQVEQIVTTTAKFLAKHLTDQTVEDTTFNLLAERK